LLQDICYIWLEVLIVVAMKTMVIWVVVPCSSERAWHFRGMYHFHHQAKRVSQTRNEQKHSSSAWKIWRNAGNLCRFLWRSSPGSPVHAHCLAVSATTYSFTHLVSSTQSCSSFIPNSTLPKHHTHKFSPLLA
jgi:hypothetical protein